MSTVPDPQDLPPDLPVNRAAEDACVLAATGTALHAEALKPGAHGPYHTHCENCGTKLDGPFCHKCGQHDFEFHRSFRHVVYEALEAFFHFEGKFFTNIATLLFRPGRLTGDFNRGKRAAQMPPFRLYLFVSVLFFFLVFLTGGQSSSGDTSVHTSLSTEPLRIEGSENSAFLRWTEEVAANAADARNQARLSDAFLHSIPRLLLFSLPFFALYTRVLFRKSGWVYLQHLVLALHFHTFVYLWILVRDGWVFLTDFASSPLSRLVWVASMVWLFAYPAQMLRELFGNSWAKTLVKTTALGFTYLLTLGFAFAAGFLALVLMM